MIGEPWGFNDGGNQRLVAKLGGLPYLIDLVQVRVSVRGGV